MLQIQSRCSKPVQNSPNRRVLGSTPPNTTIFVRSLIAFSTSLLLTPTTPPSNLKCPKPLFLLSLPAQPPLRVQQTRPKLHLRSRRQLHSTPTMTAHFQKAGKSVSTTKAGNITSTITRARRPGCVLHPMGRIPRRSRMSHRFLGAGSGGSIIKAGSTT